MNVMKQLLVRFLFPLFLGVAAASVSGQTTYEPYSFSTFAGTAGIVVGGLGAPLVAPLFAPSTGSPKGASPLYPFFGEHQAGISTPVQDHLHFAAFDLVKGASRDDLVSLLKEWSYAASRMTQGLDVSASGALQGNPEAPPDDKHPFGQRIFDEVLDDPP